MQDIHLVYITCPDMENAAQLANGLIEKRLAACANILPGMTSLYRWEGTIQQSDEVVLIVKTSRGHCRTIIDYVERHHPYDCPAILAFPVTAASSGFASWVHAEVQDM